MNEALHALPLRLCLLVLDGPRKARVELNRLRPRGLLGRARLLQLHGLPPELVLERVDLLVDERRAQPRHFSGTLWRVGVPHHLPDPAGYKPCRIP